MKIKVISFNIRGDYKDGINKWGNREKHMINFFNKEKPDIICLQEAQKNQSADLIKGLSGFEIVGAISKTENVKEEHNPILYKKDKYILLNYGTFALSEQPKNIGSIGWDAKYPRIATWVNLKVKESGQIIFIINTHLDNKGIYARRKSIEMILDTIPSCTKSESIILTGDLNDTNSSQVYKAITSKNLSDTYSLSKKVEGVNYSFHKFGRREFSKRVKIDYIFVSKRFNVLSTNIPKETPKKGVYLSDHNPIIVCLEFSNNGNNVTN